MYIKSKKVLNINLKKIALRLKKRLLLIKSLIIFRTFHSNSFKFYRYTYVISINKYQHKKLHDFNNNKKISFESM